jgi:hypothetical protein
VRSRACGTVIDPGRAVYRPPEVTGDYVRARDRHCQFPGCRTAAERCDIDHRVPYQSGGATCPCNLDVLCRAHHRLKTFTPWRAVPDANGRLTWTSPLGNTYALAPDPHGSASRCPEPPPPSDTPLISRSPLCVSRNLSSPSADCTRGHVPSPNASSVPSSMPTILSAAPVTAHACSDGARSDEDDPPPF